MNLRIEYLDARNRYDLKSGKCTYIYPALFTFQCAVFAKRHPRCALSMRKLKILFFSFEMQRNFLINDVKILEENFSRNDN